MAKITLGNFIVKKRKNMKLSSRQLALACEVTPAYMNDIEKSKRIPSSEVLTRIAMKLKLDEKEVYQLFDLAVDDNKGKVSYDIAEYIMNNDELRQCIRYVIKIKDNSIWKKMLNEINQEGQL